MNAVKTPCKRSFEDDFYTFLTSRYHYSVPDYRDIYPVCSVLDSNSLSKMSGAEMIYLWVCTRLLLRQACIGVFSLVPSRILFLSSDFRNLGRLIQRLYDRSASKLYVLIHPEMYTKQRFQEIIASRWYFPIHPEM